MYRTTSFITWRKYIELHEKIFLPVYILDSIGFFAQWLEKIVISSPVRTNILHVKLINDKVNIRWW